MTEASVSMSGGHWFWLGLVLMNVGWYCTVTVYVSIKGALDIRHMLAELDRKHQASRQS